MGTWLELLEKLSSCSGPPGGEEPVAEIMRFYLKKKCTIVRDRMGSLIGLKEGTARHPRIMIAAHMDEIGFMVQSVTKKGYIRLQPLGGWTAKHLPAQKLLIHGAQGAVVGIIASMPPHFNTETQKDLGFEDLLVDVGANSRSEALALGIEIGDLVTPSAHFSVLNQKYLANKAWDDRVGCAAMIAVMEELGDHPNTVAATATVQEEVGARGAEAAVAIVRPDVAVVLEGAPADDVPGLIKDDPQGGLGAGCQIRLFDPSTIIHRRFLQWVKDLAERNDVSFQQTVRRGGATDAKAIHVAQGGIPTVVLAVPVRYAHSHNGLIHIDDFAATVLLVRLILENLNESVFQSFLPV